MFRYTCNLDNANEWHWTTNKWFVHNLDNSSPDIQLQEGWIISCYENITFTFTVNHTPPLFYSQAGAILRLLSVYSYLLEIVKCFPAIDPSQLQCHIVYVYLFWTPLILHYNQLLLNSYLITDMCVCLHEKPFLARISRSQCMIRPSLYKPCTIINGFERSGHNQGSWQMKTQLNREISLLVLQPWHYVPRVKVWVQSASLIMSKHLLYFQPWVSETHIKQT